MVADERDNMRKSMQSRVMSWAATWAMAPQRRRARPGTRLLKSYVDNPYATTPSASVRLPAMSTSEAAPVSLQPRKAEFLDLLSK